MAIKAPLILSLQTGQTKSMGTQGAADPLDQPWTSAIYKDPVEGPVWLSVRGLKGDAVADKDDHGGQEMAVLAYSAEHYPAWRAELSQPFLKYGAFGENFTVSRQTEETVCIGDVYAIGGARLQVSMPRAPCWKLTRRFHLADMVERVHSRGWGGWYLRVLTEGFVERSSFIVLESRPHPDWSVLKAYVTYTGRAKDRKAAAELAACEALSAGWRAKLSEGAG